jgi:hypothetical protein
VALTLSSLFGTTQVTLFTAVSGTIAGSVLTIPFDFVITLTTAAVGATGTIECHGFIGYGLAGTAVLTMAADTVVAVSSTIDLTAQDTLALTITPTTAGITAGNVRQLVVEQIA